MRVITGQYKNRSLLMPKNKESIRTTTGMVKKAVIDILQGQINGSSVLDLFAGSGNVGIEFLSNDANKVVFSDVKREHCAIIKKNCGKLSISEERYQIIQIHYKKALQICDKKFCFDFIFVDPPYKSNISEECLETIAKYNIYDKNTYIILEHHFKEHLPERIGDFLRIDYRSYGMTILDFFKFKG